MDMDKLGKPLYHLFKIYFGVATKWARRPQGGSEFFSVDMYIFSLF